MEALPQNENDDGALPRSELHTCQCKPELSLPTNVVSQHQEHEDNNWGQLRRVREIIVVSRIRLAERTGMPDMREAGHEFIEFGFPNSHTSL